jgi:hypothetical protein
MTLVVLTKYQDLMVMWRKMNDLPPGQAAEAGKINFLVISFLLYNQRCTNTFYHENEKKKKISSRTY